MIKVRFWSLGILVLLASMAATPPSVAGLDVDLGLSMSTGDDSRLFVNICARYFNHEPRFVEGWAVRYANPDDLAVAMFISQRSSRSPDVVFALRQQGMAWWDIGLRLGVPVNAWFVPVEHDPGPPYGKAYGYWKKHQHTSGLKADPACLLAWVARLNWLEEKSLPPTMARIKPDCGSMATKAPCT